MCYPTCGCCMKFKEVNPGLAVVNPNPEHHTTPAHSNPVVQGTPVVHATPVEDTPAVNPAVNAKTGL